MNRDDSTEKNTPMSDKDKTTEQLSAYLDGELSDADRRKLRRAMEADADLSKELRKLQAVRELLGKLPKEQAGDEFVAGVLGRAERRNLIGSSTAPQAPPRVRWVRWLASAAVLLIAAGIGVVVFVGLNQPTFPELVEQDRQEAPDQLARRLDDVSRKAASARGGPASEPALPGRLAKTGDAEPTHFDKAPALRRDKPLAKTDGDVGYARGLKEGAAAGEAVLAKAGRATGGMTGPDERLAAAVRSDVERPAEGRTPRKTGPAESSREEARRTADEAPVVVRNEEVIFTDNLPQAQRDVERVLETNNIKPLVVQPPAATNAEQVRRQIRARVSNYAQLVESGPNQVQYFAYVTPEQLANVSKDLARVRLRQKVLQAIAEDRLRETAQAQPVRRDAAGTEDKKELQQLSAGPSDRYAQRARAPRGGGATAPAAARRQWVAVEQARDGRLRLKLPKPPASRPGTSQPPAPMQAPVEAERRIPAGRQLEQREQVRAGQAAQRRPPDLASQRAVANVEPLLITLNYRAFRQAEADRRARPRPATRTAAPARAQPATSPGTSP